jgi:hypothetical protein
MAPFSACLQFWREETQGSRVARRLLLFRDGGNRMEINWQRDVDAALRQANETGKPVLLDFTAAPM